MSSHSRAMVIAMVLFVRLLKVIDLLTNLRINIISVNSSSIWKVSSNGKLPDRKEELIKQEAYPDMNKEHTILVHIADAKLIGKTRAHPVFILTNLLGKTVETSIESKDFSKSMLQPEASINRLINMTNVEEDEVEVVVSKFKEVATQACEGMGQVASILSSFIETLDDDIGVIETDMQPAAPIIDPSDRSSIEVYGRMRMDRSSGNSASNWTRGTSATAGLRTFGQAVPVGLPEPRPRGR